MLFGKKIGFSGTPSDILPLELGSCQYERGSDGKVVHYLTSPDVVQLMKVSSQWDARLILDMVAKVCCFFVFVLGYNNWLCIFLTGGSTFPCFD